MQLDGTEFDCLSRRTVTIEGEWSALPRRDWCGSAIADESLVAIVFLSVNDHVEWAKSNRTQTDSLAVRLGLGYYDSTGLDVQVTFSLARSDRRARCIVSSPHYVPEIVAPRQLHTGVIQLFAVVDGRWGSVSEL